MVVDVDLEGSGLKRCRLAAFLFCGQALPPLPSLQARKAVARDGFVWCVCVCAWFVFALLAHGSVAGGCDRGPGATADDADLEGSSLKQPRLRFLLSFLLCGRRR